MAGLIALVGGNEFRRDCESMDRALLARLGGEPRVVIVPTAAAHENPGKAAENGVRYFRRLGAQAEAAMIIDANSARQASFVAQIRNADLVYFTGGDPVHLLETMRDSPAWKAVLEVLDDGGAIAGRSICRRCSSSNTTRRRRPRSESFSMRFRLFRFASDAWHSTNPDCLSIGCA